MTQNLNIAMFPSLHSFFNKNVVYKNIEAKICQIFKNILRI